MMMRVTATFWVFCVTLGICLINLPAESRAQYGRTQPDGTLNTFLQVGSLTNAKKSWERFTPPMQGCLARAIVMRSNRIEESARRGSGAEDALASIEVSRCHALTDRELRQDFDCTIVQYGISMHTRCDEEYSESTGSFSRAISHNQYIFDGLRGEQVSITQKETHDAMEARVDREAKIAAAECRKHEAEAFTFARRFAAAHKTPEAADVAFSQSLYAMLAEHPYCRYARVYLRALGPQY